MAHIKESHTLSRSMRNIIYDNDETELESDKFTKSNIEK